MKWNKLYHYPPCVRSTTDGLRTYNVGNEKLPSVTSILQATQSDEKRESLARWQAKVGKDEATRVKQQAASRGTNMHLHLEKFILGQGHLDLTEEGKGWWHVEPNVGRVAHGVQGRVHRLKGLGNAIVQQIAEEIGKAIINATSKNYT